MLADRQTLSGQTIRSNLLSIIRSLCHANAMNGTYPGRTLATVSACALALAGCGEGWNASEADSRNWLPKALPYLERVIVLLRTCQPKRPSGYNTIWIDGSSDVEKPHCAFGDDREIENIRSELKAANVLGVAYLPSGSPRQQVDLAQFILFREGIGISGAMTSVTYRAQPQPCVRAMTRDERSQTADRAITPAPCRWFWARSEG